MKPHTLFLYHFVIFAVYLLTLPFLLKNFSGVLVYQFTLENFMIALLAFAVSVLVFIVVDRLVHNFGKIGWRHLSPKIFIALVLYAALVATLEEVIFRGVVQNYFSQLFDNGFLSILVATIFFASVHLPNAARGWGIRKWNWEFFFLASIGGVLLGSAYAITNELFVPTLLHAFFLISLRAFRTPTKSV